MNGTSIVVYIAIGAASIVAADELSPNQNWSLLGLVALLTLGIGTRLVNSVNKSSGKLDSMSSKLADAIDANTRAMANKAEQIAILTESVKTSITSQEREMAALRMELREIRRPSQD